METQAKMKIGYKEVVVIDNIKIGKNELTGNQTIELVQKTSHINSQKVKAYLDITINNTDTSRHTIKSKYRHRIDLIPKKKGINRFYFEIVASVQQTNKSIWKHLEQIELSDQTINIFHNQKNFQNTGIKHIVNKFIENHSDDAQTIMLVGQLIDSVINDKEIIEFILKKTDLFENSKTSDNLIKQLKNAIINEDKDIIHNAEDVKQLKAAIVKKLLKQVTTTDMMDRTFHDNRKRLVRFQSEIIQRLLDDIDFKHIAEAIQESKYDLENKIISHVSTQLTDEQIDNNLDDRAAKTLGKKIMTNPFRLLLTETIILSKLRS